MSMVWIQSFHIFQATRIETKRVSLVRLTLGQLTYWTFHDSRYNHNVTLLRWEIEILHFSTGNGLDCIWSAVCRLVRSDYKQVASNRAITILFAWTQVFLGIGGCEVGCIQDVYPPSSHWESHHRQQNRKLRNQDPEKRRWKFTEGPDGDAGWMAALKFRMQVFLT